MAEPKKKPQPRRNTEQVMKASPQTVHRPHTKARIEGPRVRTAEGIRRGAKPSNPDFETKLGHMRFVQQILGFGLTKAEVDAQRDVERRVEIQYHRNAERAASNEWAQPSRAPRSRGSRKTKHA